MLYTLRWCGKGKIVLLSKLPTVFDFRLRWSRACFVSFTCIAFMLVCSTHCGGAGREESFSFPNCQRFLISVSVGQGPASCLSLALRSCLYALPIAGVWEGKNRSPFQTANGF